MTQTASRDLAGGSGGPRSLATRQAILDSARSDFSARGFHGATVRSIAAGAGIDPSMVMRYFGSKAALFAVATKLVLHPVDFTDVPVRERGQAIIQHVVDRWEDSSSHDTLALLRTAIAEEGVATQLQAVFDQEFRAPIAKLGGDRIDERTAAVAATVLGLAITRYVLRLDPIANMPVRDLVHTFAHVIQPLLAPST